MTCVRCAGSGDCIATSHGPMCRPCFQTALKAPPRAGQRLFSVPEPGKLVWVVVEPPGVYITVDNTLYAFERQQDAEFLASEIGASHKIKGLRTERTAAWAPLAYVLRNRMLRLICVKEVSGLKMQA